MARIAGVNIPDNKHAVVSLTYIFGIGTPSAKEICAAAGVNPTSKIKDLSEETLDLLRGEVASRYGRRSETRDLHEHKTFNGFRLLPRASPSKGPSSSWSAH